MERLRGETKDEMLAPKDGAWSWRVMAGDFRINELCVRVRERTAVNLIIIFIFFVGKNINVGGCFTCLYNFGVRIGNYYFGLRGCGCRLPATRSEYISVKETHQPLGPLPMNSG